MVAIGERFTVSAPQEVKNDKGRVLANYRPEFDYRVTPRNVGIVTQMIADGKASAGGHARGAGGNQVASGLGKLRGRVKVGSKEPRVSIGDTGGAATVDKT